MKPFPSDRDIVTLALILLMATLSLTASPQGNPPAQRPQPRTESPRIPTFEGRGGAPAPSEDDAPPARRVVPLTSDQHAAIKALLGHPPKNLYARLSPAQPRSVGRGALVFSQPMLVEGGEGWAFMKPGVETKVSPSRVSVWVNSPAANRRYLVDCAVSGTVPKDRSTMFTIDVSGVRQTVEFPAGTTWPNHVIAMLNATDAGWHKLVLMNDQSHWHFHSCDISGM